LKQLWGHDGGDWKSALYYEVDEDNEKRIKEYLTKLAKENNVDIKDMSLEDMVEELDDDYDVRNALSSSKNDAQAGDYSNYLYNELKSAVEEYGEVIKMNDEGIMFDVDVEQWLSLDDEWVINKIEEFDGDIAEMFEEMVWSGGIDTPKFNPDDRYIPDVNKEHFNEMLSDRLSEFM
jgi:hypothetical protein